MIYSDTIWLNSEKDYYYFLRDKLQTSELSPEAVEEFRKACEYRRQTGVAAPEEDRPLYVIGLNHPRRIETIADALLRQGYPARVAEKVIGANFVGALTAIWG